MLQGPMPINYQDRIVRDPKIAGGEAVIRGTRVTLRTVLASLAEGASSADISGRLPDAFRGRCARGDCFRRSVRAGDLPLTEAPVKR